MRIPYRTRQVMKRWAIALLVIAVTALLLMVFGLLWLGRHVVYTDNGIRFDFDKTSMDIVGQQAVPPAPQETVSIYYNEGDNVITTNTELTTISGYYISSDELEGDLTELQEQINQIPTGSAVMIEVKNAFGEFNYSTSASTYRNSSVDQKKVDDLIKKLNRSNMYTIAKVTAFQDYHYGLNNVDEGLFSTGGAYLWRDDMGCYWLSPTSQKYQSYLVQIATELRGLGFDEVVFDQFLFPDSTKYRFSGEKQEALSQAADKLIDTCATSSFAVSFVSTEYFQLPEGRSRLYLRDVEPADLGKVSSTVAVPDNAINLVFLTAYHDTRYDAYSVLRPITAMR